MNMFSRSLIIGLSVVALGACSRAVSTIPVQGSAPAISRLAGDWEGEYSSIETGRSGSISFRLRAGSDTAEGEVMMTVGEQRLHPSARGEGGGRTGHSEPLTIRFVQTSGTEVQGTLDPYRAPDCGCTLTTTFRGEVSGNVIEGSYETKGSGFHHPTQRGRWRVVRRS
jgi:hypothetical protein